MSDADAPGDGTTDHDLAQRRLRLDLDDLRFENARLKTSIAERQAEIAALSEELGLLRARFGRLDRVAAWASAVRRLASIRVLVRRR